MHWLGLLGMMAFGADSDHFESKVRPVFAARCQQCHGPKLQSGGLNLTTGEGLNATKLITALSHGGSIKMPPSGKLADADLAAIRDWVAGGAKWPTAAGAAPNKHWAFEPVKPGKKSIDEFVSAKLAEKGLALSPPAGKLTLLRRVTYDLTGLPPSEAEVRAWIADSSPAAYAELIERLLASPRYGEHWGRHWLDVARYADSTGADEDHRYPHAWRYRDYVIDAFNRDLPYDQFVREQIAGDLMPAPDGAEVNTRGIVATGFLALGPKLVAEQDKTKMFYDVVDEQIDTAGKAILGLTIACARCHDHKFDPIPTQDYYSLAGMFASTRQFTKLEGTVSQLYFASLAPKAETEGWDAHKKQLEAKQKEIDAVLGAERKKWRKEMIPLTAKYMLAAREVYHDGRNLEAVRAELGFDNEILERWIEYLKPSKDRRAHLEAFYNAADFVKAASAYQDNVNEAFNKSKFMPGDYRFYTEITSGKGPLNPAESRFSAELLATVKTLRGELKAIKDAAPPEPPMACGVGEGTSVEQKIFVRGDYNTPGDAAPRRFPRAVAGPDQPSAVKGSGRLEFAAWLTDRRNPLTARVLVNRLWQWHFGEGLVRTPNNFGTVGDRPSHPELLDYLAATFVESGWSVKAMHRLILNTRAYQMASDIKPEHIAKDSENRLLSRFGRRRLSVEEIRDSLLAIDGSIDFTMGGTLQKGEGTDKEFSEDRKSLDPDQSKRRLVYLPLRRSNLASVLNLFDFGDATTSNEARAQTNVAPQALFMMNSKFVEGRARGLAEAAGPNIESAYLRVLGRPPHEDEVDDAKQYIAKFPGKDPLVSFMRALIASNEFLYVH